MTADVPSGSPPAWRGVDGSRPHSRTSRVPGWFWSWAAAVWLAGAVVVWNGVFDAHIVGGARDYVDRQQSFIDGRGPRVDIDQAMDGARVTGARAATGWAAVELLPGIAAWALLRRRYTQG